MSQFKHQKRTIALLFALVYPTLGAVTFAARAQQADTTSVAQPEINVVKGESPLTFEPFEIKDPATGAVISADQQLTLPDGRQVPAGEYYAELNRLEQEFNQLGYSLRDNVAERTIQESVSRDQERFAPQIQNLQEAHQQLDRETVDQIHQKFDRDFIQQEILQHEQLEQQLTRARDAATPGQFNPGQLNPGQLNQNLKIKQLQGEKLLALDPSTPVIKSPGKDRIDRATLKKLQEELIRHAQEEEAQRRDQAKPATYYGERSLWVGDRSRFYAEVKGRIDISSSGHTVQTNAEGNAGGYIFNAPVNALRATANVQAPDSGNLSARLNVSVFGQSVYDRQFTEPKLHKSDSFAYTIDKPITTFRFTIGPIPMKASFGVRGAAGLRYELYASPRYASAKTTPFLNTQVYAEGGADIVIAGAGVGANLTLLNDELELGAKANIRTDFDNRKIFLDTNFYAYNKLDALSGNLYAYAYTYVPKFAIPPWEEKRWNWKIWDWAGFHTEGYLFNVSDTKALL